MDCSSFTPDLSDAQFGRICRLLFDQCGISLRPGKEALVRSRLGRRLNRLGLDSFDRYMELVESGESGDELRAMVDALTTNKTSFFREAEHFHYLMTHLLPRLCADDRPLRFWSAGCSTGEEPYTLAIVLREAIPQWEQHDCRILATDISDRVLEEARRGVYAPDRLENVPAEYLTRYFHGAAGGKAPAYEVREKLRSVVRFARLNLMDPWPMKGPFDAIFCRNVMIYFELATRQELVRRFARLLAPGGHLFVGHSESLTQSFPEIGYVQPAVYVKKA